jgi:hypothetical protein
MAGWLVAAILGGTRGPLVPLAGGDGSACRDRRQGAAQAVVCRVWVLSGSLQFPRAGAEPDPSLSAEGGRPIVAETLTWEVTSEASKRGSHIPNVGTGQCTKGTKRVFFPKSYNR